MGSTVSVYVFFNENSGFFEFFLENPHDHIAKGHLKLINYKNIKTHKISFSKNYPPLQYL